MPDIHVAPPLFRQLMGRFPTGVTVLTARDQQDQPVGMTASSLASVSLSPPLISVCIELSATVHDTLVEADHFVVNVLGEEQEELSRRFAQPQAVQDFVGVGWLEGDVGVPRLQGCVAHIECAREATFPGGDHTILLGRVVSGAVGDGRPLVYYRGGYTGLGE